MFDVTPFLKPGDPFVAEFAHKMLVFKEYYDLKHRVARFIEPRSIVEIGVRAGYSAAAFLTGAYVGTRYRGYDADMIKSDGLHGGVPGYTAWAAHMLHDYFPQHLIEIRQLDTQATPLGLVGVWDFGHIDGDHSEAGCYQDLCSLEAHVRWLLVDDYHFIPDVRRAVDKFLRQRGYENMTINSLRGEKLIKLPAADHSQDMAAVSG